MSFEDIINGIFRPMIGLLIGMAGAYLVQLAGGVGWPIAAGFGVLLALLFGGVILFDRVLEGATDRLFGGSGVKPARKGVTQEKPHWFVRFGWIFGLVAGYAAVFLLPEEMLAWL